MTGHLRLDVGLFPRLLDVGSGGVPKDSITFIVLVQLLRKGRSMIIPGFHRVVKRRLQRNLLDYVRFAFKSSGVFFTGFLVLLVHFRELGLLLRLPPIEGQPPDRLLVLVILLNQADLYAAASGNMREASL
mmetsp:Transcript_10061/g.15364  ORF Transcript_10061/g.15364 Transcript_10061/m.15364 type:complete len:131 (-) Transcript_10061:4137-4529(-)